MKETKDNFSAQAPTYGAFRPHYPEALYRFLYEQILHFNRAWDCGTGNGQVASKLSEKFIQVEATDISQNQLNQAVPKPNISYSLARAEEAIFQDNYFDLITVAQAIHWFDFEAFYPEVIRVAKPGAMLAVWGYGLLQINPEIDVLFFDFYENKIGLYWDAERNLVDEKYASIPFPFAAEIKMPDLEIIVSWTFDQFIGYMNSWSSVQHYIKKHGHNPVDVFAQTIKHLWPGTDIKQVRFPLFGRLAIINK